MTDNLSTKPSPYTEFYLPEPVHYPVGTALSPNPPTLFQPYKIKSTQFQNRIGVSPMCTYSAASHGPLMGHATQFHLIHYGAMAMRSPGLMIIEATAVSPEGRLSPECLGIWTDSHAEAIRPIVEFAHAQGVKIGIQLNHGGRKSSGLALPVHLAKTADAEHYGWPTVAPSAISYDEERYSSPRALGLNEIKDIVHKFKAAAKRAYEIAGVDFVEIHSAHGYLLSEFLSGLSNKRTDEYGGSFENRTRLLLEIVDAVKDHEHPLFVRISASDLTELAESWDLEQSKRLALILQEHGVDLLDVSNGGNYNKAQRRPKGPASQAHLSKAIRDHLEENSKKTMLVASVGGFHDGDVAQAKLEDESADVILVGREYLKNPGAALKFADQLGVVPSSGRAYEWTYNPPKY